MAWLVSIAVSFFLLLGADIPDVPPVFRLRPPSAQQIEFPPGQNLPVLPALSGSPGQAKPLQKATLQPESRLALVRYIHGEFCRALRPLPGGKKGLRLKAGQPLDDKALQQALAIGGQSIHAGDTVQITKMEFHDRAIVLDINGGGHRKTRLRDRIHIEMSGAPMPQTTTTTTNTNNGPPGFQSGAGSTIYLDFDKLLPDMTPDELKKYLGGVLDFSKQRSASVQWVETLPPQFQKAIHDRHAAVGMDREMVIAAMGKPERKVRERDAEGTEIEDWIYGQPPAKTVFVRFAGDHVISVKQFP